MLKLHHVGYSVGLGLLIHHCESAIVVGGHRNVEPVLATYVPGFVFVILVVDDNLTFDSAQWCSVKVEGIIEVILC